MDDERKPVLLLAAFAVLLLAISVWNLARELSTLAVELPPVLAFVIDGTPAVALLYAAYRLDGSDLDATARWQVTVGAVAGLLVFLTVTSATIVVRLLENRPVGEPQFVLLTTAGGGAVAGALVGVFYARARRDAREARRARNRAMAARDEAKSARDNFKLLNSIIRHDVLNSMMIVRARAEFIADETDDRVQSFAETIVAQSDDIVEQVERTRAVLNALSDDETDLEETSLTDAVETEVETVRTTYDDVAVAVDTPDEDLHVWANDLLPDVLSNLLSNAVEYADDGDPRIRVTAEQRDGAVECRIADNGPGVPDELKEAVFRRDETGLHEDGTGSGFGLFFVDTMMDSYGGNVRVEDRDPMGAVFVLEFSPA